jgi:prevent-host-death family protein
MKFTSDELMPFFEVRTGMSKFLMDVQTGKDIVITRHGKPTGALISAAKLYRYREQERIMSELLSLLKSVTPLPKLDAAQAALVREAEQLLARLAEHE